MTIMSRNILFDLSDIIELIVPHKQSTSDHLSLLVPQSGRTPIIHSNQSISSMHLTHVPPELTGADEKIGPISSDHNDILFSEEKKTYKSRYIV